MEKSLKEQLGILAPSLGFNIHKEDKKLAVSKIKHHIEKTNVSKMLSREQKYEQRIKAVIHLSELGRNDKKISFATNVSDVLDYIDVARSNKRISAADEFFCLHALRGAISSHTEQFDDFHSRFLKSFLKVSKIIENNPNAISKEDLEILKPLIQKRRILQEKEKERKKLEEIELKKQKEELERKRQEEEIKRKKQDELDRQRQEEARERIKIAILERKRKEEELEQRKRAELERKKQEKELERIQEKLKRFEIEQKHRQINSEREEISAILDRLIESTKQYICLLPNLEKLNEVFRKHCIGSYIYPDAFEQNIYLLRYFYAYYYEYRKIMEWICELLPEINVVSIGCGSGIDALALKHITSHTPKKYSYIGIDIVNWRDAKLFSDGDPITLYNTPIKHDTENYLKNATVLFFPRSLSDITDRDMEDIEKWIKECLCLEKNICVAASFIYRGNVNNGKPTGRQYDRYSKIIKLFENKDYFVDEAEILELIKKDGEGDKIWNVDDEVFKKFKPNNLINFIYDEIPNNCKDYNNNKVHCNICEKNDEGKCEYKWPKTSLSSIHYKGVILRKRGMESHDIKR